MTTVTETNAQTKLLAKIKLIYIYTLLGAPQKLDFISLSHPKSRDFLWLQKDPYPSSISLARRCAYQIVRLANELLHDGCDVAPLIDFIVEPNPESSQELTEYYQVSCTLIEAIQVSSREYIWFYIKDHTTTLFYDVDKIVWLLYGYLNAFNHVDDMSELSNQKKMQNHPLTEMFPSFLLFSEAALHTWCDNTGFVEAHDHRLREGALRFVLELTKSHQIFDQLSRPRTLY